jgi:uncharacterized protein
MADALPVQPEERIQSLDALRGFALFGVLLINMLSFTGPLERLFIQPWTSTAHPVLTGLVIFLVQGKFYCLFSFLFGLGFSLQLSRLEARGIDAAALYRRRLFVLMAIGLAQGLLVWMGDILFAYGCFGFLLLLFRKRQDRTLLIWAASLLLAWTLLGLTAGFFTWMGSVSAPDKLAAAAQHQAIESQKMLAQNIQTYAHGPYAALFILRIKELAQNYALTFLAVGPQIFAMFLMGAWTGRRGIVKDPGAHRALIASMLRWAWPLGLLANAVYVWALIKGMPGPANWRGVLAQGFYMVGAPALTLAYAATLLRLWEGGGFLWLKRRLAPMGRMALTHYLTHSLLCTNLYYFWGTGRYGAVGMPEVLGVTAAIYLAQMAISPWWLSRFRMGPAEWIWRRLTYGERAPFKA